MNFRCLLKIHIRIGLNIDIYINLFIRYIYWVISKYLGIGVHPSYDCEWCETEMNRVGLDSTTTNRHILSHSEAAVDVFGMPCFW